MLTSREIKIKTPNKTFVAMAITLRSLAIATT